MRVINSRVKYSLMAVTFFWLTTLFANYIDFKLGINGAFQVLINILSPFVIYTVFIGIAFFIKSDKWFRWNIFLINLIFTLLLISNVYYYREFTDFLTVTTIIKSGSVSEGMTGSTLRMFKGHDFIYMLNLLILCSYNIYYFKRNFTKQVKLGLNRSGFVALTLGILVSFGTLLLADIDRPQLLTRGFDSKYTVKYLGLPAQLTQSGVQSYKVNQKRAHADSNGVEETLKYTMGRDDEFPKNSEYFGKLAGKNVVYIHLESFQQFLINYKYMDDSGNEYEVTPNLNKLFNNNDSLSYDNIYHQVSQGKTSDAEMMIENGLFGVKQGSALVTYGTSNTFYSMPNILGSLGNYTTSVFHGNTSTFWNRNNAYKSFGYDNFYSLEYFKNQDTYGYGLRDEDFFSESYDMYENINSPKYSKFIPVSNHFPYKSDMFETDFPNINTSDETINGYFITANYMDKEIGKFMSKFSEEELNNTLFILYGDHYGISNTRNKELGKFLAKQEALKKGETFDEDNYKWESINNVPLQTVPLIFYSKGSNLGEYGVQHEIGGQIDIMKTLLSLLGYDNLNLLQVGRDLTSNNKENFVTFRDGTIVTDKYIIKDSKVYNKSSLDEIKDTSGIQLEVDNLVDKGTKQLFYSDKIMEENLQSLYLPNNKDLKPVDKDKISYTKK